MAKIEHLFEKFQPENYQIYLDINRQAKVFQGTVKITGQASDTVINLHQKDLVIDEVTVNSQPRPFTVDNQREVIEIQLAQAGQLVVTVKYHAPITDSMMGIYPSYYQVDGQTKELIGTQFETTFARQAFPSIDEPEAKATFDLAIKFDEHPGETILSNMPEIKTEDGVHYFDQTVKMSTYLVAFAFGELQSQTTETNSGVQVGVFSTKAHPIEHLDFALDIAKRSIEFFEDFYQTPYPLPHSWQLALPDFSAGAMENWGLVTYREAYLLLDAKNAALSTKQTVATVIAHELAHQWFGDLVTMKWWDDLWLNESFANMMEYVAIDAIEPTWQIWETFQSSEAAAALNRDATDGVQSVHVAVNDPAEIDALFDGAIVYAKGARMLVMVRALIGDKALRSGLKQYFSQHQYQNATGADLWKALGEASGIDIGSIMHSWLEQPGYPVIKAQVKHGELVIDQRQFFIGEGIEQKRLWSIPLNSNYDETPKIMESKALTLGDYKKLHSQNEAPFRLNVNNNSHFIIQYDETLLNDIFDHLTDLSAIDQLQLLQDLRLLAQGGQITYAKLIPWIKKLADQKSALVNQMIYRIVEDLKLFVEPDSKAEKLLKELVGHLSDSHFNRLGFMPKANEDNDDQLNRPLVLKAALYAENSTAVVQAHEIFEQHQTDLSNLPAAIRRLVLQNEVEHFGNETLFNQLLNTYQQTANASLKNDLTGAITSFKSKTLLQKVVDCFEDAKLIKPQDLRAWFRGVLANPNGEELAWNWIRKDWDWLEATVGGDMEFSTFITVIASIFKNESRLLEFKAFFEPKINTPGLTREITMDISVIKARVKLIDSQKPAVLIALKG